MQTWSDSFPSNRNHMPCSDANKDTFASPLHMEHSLHAFCSQDLSITSQKLGQISGVTAAVVAEEVGTHAVNA